MKHKELASVVSVMNSERMGEEEEEEVAALEIAMVVVVVVTVDVVLR